MNSGVAAYNLESAAGVDNRFTGSSRLFTRNPGLLRFFEDLSERSREDFLSYLEEEGLISDSGMLVIPSSRHFFYNAEDLRGVKTVVNLRQLNQIREMRDFLRTISDLMPDKSSFVGCFVDNKAQNGFSDKYDNLPESVSNRAEAYENGIESRIPFINRMYSFIDARTNRYLTRRTVINLLEEYGLQVTGIAEINGLTYFSTRKIKPAA